MRTRRSAGHHPRGGADFETGTGGASGNGTANDPVIVRSPGSDAPLTLSVFTNRSHDNATYDDKVIASTAPAPATALGRP